MLRLVMSATPCQISFSLFALQVLINRKTCRPRHCLVFFFSFLCCMHCFVLYTAYLFLSGFRVF